MYVSLCEFNCIKIQTMSESASKSIYFSKNSFIAFAFNAKSFAIAILVFFFFSFSSFFLGGMPKSFLDNVLTLVIKKRCDQDLTHSLDTPKHISVKIVPVVVIPSACGIWNGLCTVTCIHSIQKGTRNCQNQKNGYQ